ncbi:ABC-F family ATP-binding cassette domain-containing protein [Pseudogracilibacillus auburnensis]|uniref:ABC-F family ATP-binding cassette domain-containing protein n=1 Tax=Pseudogracilibacillus auburnensis TaxID=1494959 RepID=UPI001A973DCC|nr:ABC-F family ATP-binding cassette domain-containing protein [Pseudogracilibacillus auburnensis]MBO1001696.1 ABC-F family ATP-binding cassette domain-containing protein [Pseudogracilibacillus auburnensis]
MLTMENLQKSYGDKLLFEEIECTITNGDRIGLIGVNGTGKSTFLKVVAGIESPDNGTIQCPKDYRIEYLAQNTELNPELTVIEQIYYGDSVIMKTMREYEQSLRKLELDPNNEFAQTNVLKMQQQMDEFDAWEANATAKTILTKLGITEFDSKVNELSGGQKKRVAIARSLIQPANLLILDEPTNHLDNETIIWLERYLSIYKGALLIVTHDRYFLNRITNTIFELDKGTLYRYEGNYELFLEKKAEREELEASEQQKHKNTLRGELAWLRRGARARSTKQKARIERIDQLQKQTFHTRGENVEFQVGSTRLGKHVIELKSIEKSYKDRRLFTDVNFLITPGDRLGIIGPSGSGKTTLLNIIAKRIEPDSGEVKIGETVKIGYYTQGEEELAGDMRVIDYVKEVAQVVHTKEGELITVEQMLERFLFSRSKQWTYIHRLSGGEKRRLYLLKVLMTEPNVIVLDEPTNDLDTQTLSVLEEYLEHFPGVVITVSHDRYFLDRVVEELLVFNGTEKIRHFFGTYSDYIDNQQRQQKPKQEKKKVRKEGTKTKKKLSYHEQKEWDTIEDDIMELEEKVATYKIEIDATGSDFEKLQKLYEEQQKLEAELAFKMERWEELSLIVEELEK